MASRFPPTLRRFVGMNASITVRPERQPGFARDHGMFRIDQPGPPLAIERLAFDMTDLGDQLAVQLSARRDVTLRDVVTAGTSLLDRGRGRRSRVYRGRLLRQLHLAGPSPVYARQLDTEGGDNRIVNDGSPLAILGLKTEGDCTVLDNRNGARSRDPWRPALHRAGCGGRKCRHSLSKNAGLLASFVEESLRPGSRYTIYLRARGATRRPRPPAFRRAATAASCPG